MVILTFCRDSVDIRLQEKLRPTKEVIKSCVTCPVYTSVNQSIKTNSCCTLTNLEYKHRHRQLLHVNCHHMHLSCFNKHCSFKTIRAQRKTATKDTGKRNLDKEMATASCVTVEKVVYFFVPLETISHKSRQSSGFFIAKDVIAHFISQRQYNLHITAKLQA